MYEQRSYRKLMENGKYHSFEVKVEETDLWIGFDAIENLKIAQEETYKFVIALRKILNDYISIYPVFRYSHRPVEVNDNDEDFIREMKASALAAGTGPMASVAGIIAMKTLRHLEDICPGSGIIVENGGDIVIKMKEDVILTPFAGKNKHFGHIGFKIPSELKNLAICSSSGMFGHLFSYGKADLVTVFAEDACLADAWATSLANRILKKEDVENISKRLPPGVMAVLAVKDDKMAYHGPLPMVTL